MTRKTVYLNLIIPIIFTVIFFTLVKVCRSYFSISLCTKIGGIAILVIVFIVPLILFFLNIKLINSRIETSIAKYFSFVLVGFLASNIIHYILIILSTGGFGNQDGGIISSIAVLGLYYLVVSIIISFVLFFKRKSLNIDYQSQYVVEIVRVFIALLAAYFALCLPLEDKIAFILYLCAFVLLSIAAIHEKVWVFLEKLLLNVSKK